MSPERFTKLFEASKWLGGSEQLESISTSAGWDAVNAAEVFADERKGRNTMHRLSELAHQFQFPAEYYASCYDKSWGAYDRTILATGDAADAASCAAERSIVPWASALYAARAVAQENSRAPFGGDTEEEDQDERAAQCDLIRDIAGNPFTPVEFDSTWRSAKVVATAQSMYDSRDFSDMNGLATQLQNAGCRDSNVLQHCTDSTHVRGCWLVDAILQK